MAHYKKVTVHRLQYNQGNMPETNESPGCLNCLKDNEGLLFVISHNKGKEMSLEAFIRCDENVTPLYSFCHSLCECVCEYVGPN